MTPLPVPSRTALCQRYLLITLRYSLLLLFAALLTPPSGALRDDRQSLPNLQGEKALAYLKEHGLDASLRDALHNSQYGIRWVEKSSLPGQTPAFAAANPAQEFYSHFTPEALHLADSSSPERAWRLQL